MTNYNERLEEQMKYRSIIVAAFDAGRDAAKYYGTDNMQKYRHSKGEACEIGEQAITSLTKELVAKAKPEVPIIADYFALDSYRNAIDQFEQNLLKALNKEK